MPKILLVEDDPDVSKVLQQHLTDIGHSVVATRGTADALTALGAQPAIDLMLVDLVMPDDQPDGLAFAEEARAHSPDTPVIFLTAYYGFVARAGSLPGVVVYKPVDLDVLTREIRAALGN
jgi:CheY-like chemotaxis protein